MMNTESVHTHITTAHLSIGSIHSSMYSPFGGTDPDHST